MADLIDRFGRKMDYIRLGIRKVRITGGERVARAGSRPFVKNCLFGNEEWNARDLLRAGASDQDLAAMIRLAVARKHAAFGGLDLEKDRSVRNMSQIAG